MSNLKDVLCLLAIMIAYGIVGRMDYDDAVMLDEAQRAVVERTVVDCRAQPVQAAPASDPRARWAELDTPPDRAPCRREPNAVVVE